MDDDVGTKFRCSADPGNEGSVSSSVSSQQCSNLMTCIANLRKVASRNLPEVGGEDLVRTQTNYLTAMGN